MRQPANYVTQADQSTNGRRIESVALGGGLINTSAIGASNRVWVLNCLAEYGPLSRAQLARLVQVPRGSVAPIVSGLLADGALVELEPEPGQARMGKPPIPLWFGPRIGHSGAVQIQAGFVTCARVDQAGNTLESRTESLAAGLTREEIEAKVIALAQMVFSPTDVPLCGIGLAWPAVMDATGEIVDKCTPIPQLEGSYLVGKLQRALDLVVLPEDDARALAIGQRWFGEAKRAPTLAALQISTGIGAGIVIDGQLLQVDGRYPEVGHMKVDLNGQPCHCGGRGCWETIASLTWLQREASQLHLPSADKITPRSLIDLASTPALALLDQYAANIAVGIFNLATCLGLRRFLLHGEVVTGGELLAGMIRAHVNTGANLPGMSGLSVEFSKLNQQAGLLGAAALPLAYAIMTA